MAKLKKECAIFVSSCDAFSDAWEPFFTLFFRYWPDCPFPVYLIANQLKYDDPRITTINIFPDKGWASNMAEALNIFFSPYFIYFQEDYFLRSPVDTKKICDLLNILIGEDAACLRLYPSPPPNKSFKKYRGVGLIDNDAPYRVSLQAAVWRAEIFKRLLIPGESGRDMEFIGSERSKLIKNPFLSVAKGAYLGINRNPAIDYYCTAIVKGKWNYGVVKFLNKEGIEIEKNRREIEPQKRYRARYLRTLPLFGAFFRFYYRALGKIKRLLKINE